MEILSGENSLSKLWEDIYDTLKNGQERLIYGVDEDKFTHSMGRGFFIMMSKYKEKNIKGRILSMEGDDNFADPSSEYRWIKKEHFGDVPYYVYGNKYAMLLWEPEPPRVVLVENKVIADNFRNQFERHWQKAIIPE